MAVKPTLSDALTALKIATGKLPQDPKYDVTGDGVVDTSDYTGLLKSYLGKDPGFAFAGDSFLSPSTKTAQDYAAENEANQQRLLQEQQETARRQTLLSDAQKIYGNVTADLVANNPNLTAQQLASLATRNYWANESEAFARVMTGMQNGTAQLKQVITGYDESNQPITKLAITTGEHPGYDTLYLEPTAQKGVYQFSTPNQVAGGFISGVIAANPETGQYLPIQDYTKQIQYTPGQSGSFLGGITNTLSTMLKDLGPLGSIGIAYLTGGLGSAIAENLVANEVVSSAVADTVGKAIASTMIGVAQGQSLDDALTNSVVNAVVKTGTPEIANTISSVVENKDLANVLTSSVASAGASLLKGGDLQDAINSAVSGGVGAEVGAVTDSSLAGNIAAGLAAGNNLETALTSAVTKMAVNDVKSGTGEKAAETGAVATDTGAKTDVSGGQEVVSQDTVEGGAGADQTITQTATQEKPISDQITQVIGLDTVGGEGGADTVSVADDTITGAGGQDTISVVSDTIPGGMTDTDRKILDLISSTDDTLLTTADDTVTGGDGGLTVGVDTITGGADTVTAGGTDTITAATGADVVADDGTTAGIQDVIDTVTGGADTLAGVGGEDTLLGGQGEGAFPGTGDGTAASDQEIIDIISGQGEGAFPGATEDTVASDQILGDDTVVTAADTIAGGQGEGAFPGTEADQVASDQVTDVTTVDAGQGEGAFPGTDADQVASDQPTTDQQLIDLISGEGEGAFPGTEDDTVASDQPTVDTTSIVDVEEEPAVDETVTSRKYAPTISISLGGKKTDTAPALSTLLQAPFYPSSPVSGLTSYRGAGEIESSETGGKRRNVWNEASLRLKDALGI